MTKDQGAETAGHSLSLLAGTTAVLGELTKALWGVSSEVNLAQDLRVAPVTLTEPF